MHAPVVGRRGGFQFQPRDGANRFVMDDFALGNDHNMMLQGGGKSRIYPPPGFPANPGPVPQGGGTRNNTTVLYGDSRTADVVSCCKGNFSSQTQKNDVAVTMSAETRLFPADAYTGMSNVSDVCLSQDNIVRTQDGHKNKGNDLFVFDWPELGGLDQDFETELRKLDSPFEIGGNNYFDDPMWPSICSPDAQTVPSCRFDNDPNSSTVANKSAAKPILIDLTSVPDSADQINMGNPVNTQQPSRNKVRETPLNSSSSSEEIERLSDADIFFPFDDMLVPTSSTTACNDKIMPCSAATRSGPDEFVSAYVPQSSAKKKKPHATTPDMFLDEISENPLEMYFPQLQPEVPMSATNSTQMHHQLPPEVHFAGGGGAALNNSGLEFDPKGGRGSGGPHESLGSSSIMKAAPVKNAGFQKLQEGMNQLDVGAKTCIRDALYRLANSVERRHCVDLTVGSSGENRIKPSSVWTETQGSPMDRSVAQLLLQKPLYRKTTDRQANRAV